LGEGYNWRYHILIPNVAGQLEPAQWLAAAPNAPEPVLFGRTNFISPIYVEPLHARAAYEMGDPNVDDTNHDLLTADHPRREQVDAALSLLDDPGISAEVHRLCLLDREHRRGIVQELNHCLDTPLGPSSCTAQQQENDI
jgi:hypothetical protein